MLPTLPQNDPNLPARRAQLARSQTIYKFAHKYQDLSQRLQNTPQPSPFPDPLPGGIGLSAAVPPDQEFTPDYLLKAAQVNAKLLANHAAIDLEYITGTAGNGFSICDWLGLTRAVGNKHFIFSTPIKAASRVAHAFPTNLAVYDSLYALIPKPEMVYKLKQGQEVSDRVFAWQRLAGADPMVLKGIASLADWQQMQAKFPVTEALYQRIMGADDSLERAIAEKRLYVADYYLLDGLPHGTWNSGILGLPRYKYIFAPIALFAWKRDMPQDVGYLVPVAIQCHQSPSPNGIFTPRDDVRWEMAKAVVQSADGNLQEMVHHLGYTHLVIEAAIVATERCLAAVHPINVLLQPHFQFTLALNDYAYHNLIAPNGAVDIVLGSTLEGSLTLLLRGMQEFKFSQAAPPTDFQNRQVNDRNGLPDYPYRDDAILLWDAIHRFVGKYLQLYYASDADVLQDGELQAWINSIGSVEGGNIQGVEPIKTLKQLIEVVAFLVFTASAQHGALNYAQFPMMSYIPNVSGGMYAPAPTDETPQNDYNYLELLAPMQQALVQFNTLYQLSSIRYGKLGYYPCLYFQDARVLPLVKDFQKNLAIAEAEIRDRDQSRFMSYPFLLPSEIGNSIFI